MKIQFKRLALIVSAASALTVPAFAQMGAVRVDPKPPKSSQVFSSNSCSVQLGQTIRLDDFQSAYDALKSQPGGTAEKSQYETQAQYEARLSQNTAKTLILSRPFRGRYRAEEQRFELWYHDLMGKSSFQKNDRDRYVMISAEDKGFTSGISNRDFGGLQRTSTSFYEIQAIDITGPRPKRRAFNFPFRPEHRITLPNVGMAARSGTAPRPGSDKALNLLRWYLDMPGAEAQANDGAMKWAYQISATSVFEQDGVSYAPGATRNNVFDQQIINGQLSCAMILDRNNVVKKVFRPG